MQQEIGQMIKQTMAIVILTATMCACAGLRAADSPGQSPVIRDRFLVLDSRIIETAENAKLTLGKTVKSKHNPLMAEDKPWEKRFDNLYANVIYDQEDKIYKCWYSPFIVDNSATGMSLDQRRKTRYRPPRGREMAICYAVSKDGVKWEKPELGLVEFEGSKQNNILWRGPHGAGVMKDLRDPDPARRYKAFFKGRNRSSSPSWRPEFEGSCRDRPMDGRQRISVRIQSFGFPLHAVFRIRLPFSCQIQTTQVQHGLSPFTHPAHARSL